MSKRRRIGWMAFIAVLGTTVVAGCAGDKPNAQQGAEATGGEKSKPPTEITVSLFDRGRVPAEEGTMDKNRWTEWVQKNGPTPVKYVLVPRNDSIAKFNVLLASGDVPDIINEYNTPFREKLYQEKQLLPLDDLIDKHAPNYKKLLEQYPELRKAGTKSDGKLYEVGRLQPTMPQYVLMVRADWLKKLNLEAPQTIEDFYKVAKAFTEQDPDGDGKKNTYGYSLAAESGIAVNKMFGNSISGYVETDGKFIYNWDRIVAANKFKQRLFADGLVDPNYLADKNGEKAKQDWLSGKLGMYVMQHAVQFNPGFTGYQTIKKNVPGAEIIPVGLPKTEFGQFGYAFLNPAQMTTVVYRGAKDPVAAIKYIDFMASEEAAKVLKFGLEGVHWKKGANGCPEPIDAEKNKKELVYVPDLAMTTSPSLTGDCSKPEASFDPNNPEQKEYLGFIAKAREIYESPDRPVPDLTHNEHFPQPPKDLLQIMNDLSQQIDNLWAKAIVSGSSYTVDMALADAKTAWNNGKGNQVEEWYAKWYVENKDKAFLSKDLYKFMK